MTLQKLTDSLAWVFCVTVWSCLTLFFLMAFWMVGWGREWLYGADLDLPLYLPGFGLALCIVTFAAFVWLDRKY